MTIESIDQSITLLMNGSDNFYIDHVAVIATQTSTWIPLGILLIYVLIRHNDLISFAELILSIGLCILIADQFASGICKPLFARYRPAQDPYIMYTVDIVNAYRGGLYGFFSSHAANTFSISTFLALLMRSRTLTWWLLSWALINCWTRVYLGVHYTSDLTVGAIWGIITGFVVYYLWKQFCHHSLIWEKKQLRIGILHHDFIPTQLAFTPSGYSIRSIHMLCAGIAITYLYISIKATWFCL